jgi:four helix bundle protein
MAKRNENKDKKVYDLEERTAKFGEAIIAFAKKLPQNPITLPLIGQIVRAGTSIGANYCEADNAVSKKEFMLRIGTCKKESKETMHWLRMIAASVENSKQNGRVLWQEAKELHLIFAAIWRKK